MISAFIDLVLPCEFKTVVVHFSGEYYAVEYSNSRIFDNWSRLKKWYDFGHPGCSQGWETELFSRREAEDIARGLKSMKDVEAYYAPHEERAREWYKKEEEWRRKNIPYKSKRFN